MSARRAAVVAIAAVLLGAATGVAWAAFSSTTTNGPNSFSAKTDLRAPTADATTGARAIAGVTAGVVRQGVGYYIYANVSDAGNPASGVQTVTADVSSFDTGVTAAALTATGGPWTVGVTTYTRRSALLTANTPLTTGSTHSYSLTMTDLAGNSATSSGFTVTIEAYSTVVDLTGGLLGYWRLGETPTSVVSDDITDTAGVLLQNHTGAVGASWTRYGSSTSGTDAVITNENRIRRDAGGAAMYYASGVPGSADYSVQADLHVKSVLSSDAAGVIGRASTSADTFYLARYVSSGFTAQWDLLRVVSGASTTLGTYPQTLSAGSTYSLRLELRGSSIRVFVNDVERISVTDTQITSADRGGVRLGFGGATGVSSNTAGFHLDNLRVTVDPSAADSEGTNTGSYVNGVTLGTTGALAGDTNTAAQFDGSNDYVSVARQISDDFSIEFWFKSTQGLNTNAQWWGNAGLVDAEVGGATNDFGVSLRSDGRITAGVGTPDVTIVSAAAGYNNGSWHHVVFTRQRSSGALKLYVDNVLAGTATGSTAALTSPANINFGRIQTGVNYLAGTIDDVAIYSTSLGSATVADHYEAGRGF